VTIYLTSFHLGFRFLIKEILTQKHHEGKTLEKQYAKNLMQERDKDEGQPENKKKRRYQ
jgi:hypothetical protein